LKSDKRNARYKKENEGFLEGGSSDYEGGLPELDDQTL
jgi:hypothetical protein